MSSVPQRVPLPGCKYRYPARPQTIRFVGAASSRQGAEGDQERSPRRAPAPWGSTFGALAPASPGLCPGLPSPTLTVRALRGLGNGIALDVLAARRAPKKRDTECNERHPDEIVEVDPMPARKNEEHLVPPLRAEPDHDRADDDCDRSCRLAQGSSSLDARGRRQIDSVEPARNSRRDWVMGGVAMGQCSSQLGILVDGARGFGSHRLRDIHHGSLRSGRIDASFGLRTRSDRERSATGDIRGLPSFPRWRARLRQPASRDAERNEAPLDGLHLQAEERAARQRLPLRLYPFRTNRWRGSRWRVQPIEQVLRHRRQRRGVGDRPCSRGCYL